MNNLAPTTIHHCRCHWSRALCQVSGRACSCKKDPCSLIWVVTCHLYGISALVSQPSFRGEITGGVANCLLFSQFTSTVDFHCCVILTSVNTLGAMYGRSRVTVKVEPRSTFTFTRGFHTLPVYLIYARKFYPRLHAHGKIRNTGNQS